MLFNLSSVVVVALAAIAVASPVANTDKKAKPAKSVTCELKFLECVKEFVTVKQQTNRVIKHN